MRLAFSYLAALQVISTLAATPAQWQGRIIYQVLTDRYAHTDGDTSAACSVSARAYCGGTWQGIINKLDYIQNMGFTAIWISPVTAQTPIGGSPTGVSGDGASYHGYWQGDLYALNANFGSTEDLKALAAAVHKRGMYLMVDVVTNHFGWPGTSNMIDYSSFIPFNNESYFHPFCQITPEDYTENNRTAIEDCWLGDNNYELVDVNTDSEEVQNMYHTWISQLVSNYSIDGLRIDTVQNVQQSFWSGFNEAAGVYCVGEVDNGNPDYVCPYQSYLDGVLNYPLFFPLTQAFESTSGNIAQLAEMVLTLQSKCKNTTLLGSFLENQDNPRYGIPIIYEGQEQHYSGGNDPYNREAIWTSGYDVDAPLYKFIAKVNQIRNLAMFRDSGYVESMATPIYNDSSTIAMRKGSNGKQTVGVFSNKGTNGNNFSQPIPATGFLNGVQVTEILGCTNTTVSGNGTIQVAMGAGQPRVFYATSNLNGTGICGH